MSPSPPAVPTPPAEKIQTLLETRQVYEAIAWAAFAQDPIASLETFAIGVQYFQQTFPQEVLPIKREIQEVLGAAYMVRLKLNKARQLFTAAGRQDLLKNVLAVALRHGQYAIARDSLREKSITKEEYEDFLRTVALPRFPLRYHPQKGFWMDQKELFEVLKEIPGKPEGNLNHVVDLMEREGDRNTVKKFIFANYAKNQQLIDKYAPAFNALATWDRKGIPDKVNTYCDSVGISYEKKLQDGDLATYFPKSGFLFIVSRGGDKRVWKEYLQLPLDYSRPGSYSEEKTILEFLAKHPSTPPGFVKYYGSVTIPNAEVELLEIEFVKGENLQKYTKESNLLPLTRVLTIISELAGMLAFFHQQGIIYMDVKAKNVIVTASGIKLLDFGMTQFIDPNRVPKATVYSLLSTPEYVPPEMATTFSATTAADVFQLGILFYQLVAGIHPFVRVDFTEGDEYRESEQLKYALANVYVEATFQHPRFSECEHITDFLKLMLSKRPEARPTANQVASELAKWLQVGSGGS